MTTTAEKSWWRDKRTMSSTRHRILQPRPVPFLPCGFSEYFAVASSLPQLNWEAEFNPPPLAQ